MKHDCPHCNLISDNRNSSNKIVKFGSFYRTSDRRKVIRYRCLSCYKTFSSATKNLCYKQLKRQLNEPTRRLLFSGVSLRRISWLLNTTRKTVARKLIFLGQKSKSEFEKHRQTFPICQSMQFDDVETFEHTKCKPISICLSVENKTRRILGLSVARMPAKGLLAKKARKKYGPRFDERNQKRNYLFKSLKEFVHQNAHIASDKNPHYEPSVRRYFPKSTYETFKGRRGCVVGQGELKRGGYDPLFTQSHGSNVASQYE